MSDGNLIGFEYIKYKQFADLNNDNIIKRNLDEQPKNLQLKNISSTTAKRLQRRIKRRIFLCIVMVKN